MRTLSCPIPTNINPLQANGYLLSITRLPGLTFFCQEANVPDLILPAPDMFTRFSDVPIPGDKLEFGDFVVTFMIDENMENYQAVHDWMIGLGFPDNNQQYTNMANSAPLNIRSELARNYSDGVLQILNNQNNPVKTIQFKDLIPITLQSLQLQSTANDTIYLAGQATFKYTAYEFV